MATQKKTPATKSVTRVEFSLSSPDYPFVAASTLGDGRVVLEEFIPREDGRCAEFFSVTGIDTDRLLAVAQEHENTDPRLLDAYDDGGLFEFLVDGNCPAVFLAEHGALPQDVFSAAGEGRVVAEIPPSEDATAIIDSFLDEYPDAELAAKYEQQYMTPMFSHRNYRRQITDRLTERQQEVLDMAHELGYYEWPRELTAEELADDLDISSATLHKHLRTAERELISVFVGELPAGSQKGI